MKSHFHRINSLAGCEAGFRFYVFSRMSNLMNRRRFRWKISPQVEIRRNSTFSSDSISPFFTGPVIITWAGSTDTAAVEFLKNWTKFCQFEYLRYHNIYWDLTRSTEISLDLLRSHKIYWDLTRSTEISQNLLRSHKIFWFGIIHLTFGVWHLICHDIPWH